jgi:NADH dehydrogenase I D subunit
MASTTEKPVKSAVSPQGSLKEVLDELEALSHDSQEDLPLIINFGPAHPATHGTLRTLMALDGETIIAAVPEIGYLHRGFEKSVEAKTYTQCITYTDRLNYLSAINCNLGFCKAVEEMLDIEIPKRAQYIRVILAELNRIADHFICVGTNLVDIGALTNFWYMFNPRERIYDILEKFSGARLTYNAFRIGGLPWDVDKDFGMDMKNIIKYLENGVYDVRNLIENNRIFMDRTMGVSVLSKEDALSYGYAGPCLRASGVEHDLRKKDPYYDYDKFNFEVPIGSKGDIYDRIMIRLYECTESIKIIQQAMEGIPEGPFIVDDHRIKFPDKEKVYGNIEALMNQFKLVIDGIEVPAGSYYSATESSNGELGYYIVSDGSGRPYRIKVRAPSFYMFSAWQAMCEGSMIADCAANLGSLNVIAGELDR